MMNLSVGSDNHVIVGQRRDVDLFDNHVIVGQRPFSDPFGNTGLVSTIYQLSNQNSVFEDPFKTFSGNGMNMSSCSFSSNHSFTNFSTNLDTPQNPAIIRDPMARLVPANNSPRVPMAGLAPANNPPRVPIALRVPMVVSVPANNPSRESKFLPRGVVLMITGIALALFGLITMTLGTLLPWGSTGILIGTPTFFGGLAMIAFS
jgi:hypothetical protein